MSYAINITIEHGLQMSLDEWREFIMDTVGVLNDNTFPKQREAINIHSQSGSETGIEYCIITMQLASELTDEAKMGLRKQLQALSKYYEPATLDLSMGTLEHF